MILILTMGLKINDATIINKSICQVTMCENSIMQDNNSALKCLLTYILSLLDRLKSEERQNSSL